MTLCSHGAARSLISSGILRCLSSRPMRPLHACRASRIGILERCRCRRRSLSSLSQARNPPYRVSARKMGSRKPVNQVWHVSRGIVFSGGNTVVYPRLPPVRDYTAPPAAATVSEGTPDCLPSIMTASVSGKASAGQESASPQGDMVAALLTTSTTVTSSTTVLVESGAAKEEQAPAKTVVDKPKPKETPPVVPPYTPLEFKIPEKAYREARHAPEGTPQSYWNYCLYRGPGEGGALDVKVKVHYCTSSRTTERVIQEHFLKEKVVGFDLEWMVNATKSSGPRKNVSLVQLASPSRIGLFHIAAYPRNDDLVAPSLKKLMEDPEITKVGVFIKGDCKRMVEHLKVQPRGQLELSHLYKLVKYSRSGEYSQINRKLVALATQVKECLGLPMFKGSDVRSSDWSKSLNMAQIIYSSSDAYASVQLYAVLDHARKQLANVPPLPHPAELNLPIPFVLPEAKKDQSPDAEVVVEDDPDGQEQAAEGGVPENGSARDDTPVKASPDLVEALAASNQINVVTETEPVNRANPAPQPVTDAKPT